MNSSPSPSPHFQLGLLHIVHLLAMVDGVIDQREKDAIRDMIGEEGIPVSVVQEFQLKITRKTEKELYHDGLELLNQCSDDEKKRAFVHLYHLSEVDDNVHVREVRLLLYALKATHVDFEDVELMARLAREKKWAGKR